MVLIARKLTWPLILLYVMEYSLLSVYTLTNVISSPNPSPKTVIQEYQDVQHRVLGQAAVTSELVNRHFSLSCGGWTSEIRVPAWRF